MIHRKMLRAAAAAVAVASVALVALVPGTASAHQARADRTSQDVPQYRGYNRVFTDDFTGKAGEGVDPRRWLYDLGQGYGCGSCPAHWGTDEIETMSSSRQNVALDGQGNLLITPIKHSDGSWTSGRIETQSDSFAAPVHGVLRIEASIQLPQTGDGLAAAGYWPAFWSMGAPFRENGHNGWPGTGEIDVMENINGRGTAFATLHCGVAPGGPCNEFSGLGVTHDDSTLQSSFHTYAMELDRSVSPQVINFYFDGTLTGSISETTVGSAAWADATDHGFFAILDVAIGGSFPWAECNFFPHPNGCSGSTPYPQVVTDATVSGVPMKVAYVAVYTSKK
jgi:beta-glucanase (GH16 family)